MASLEVLRVYWGIRGILQENESYTASNLIATGSSVLLALYLVIWQSYVLRADVIFGSILICFHGLTGIVGLGTLARFTSWCVVGVLAHYGCRRIIQVDAAHWWWMRRFPLTM